MDTLYLTSENWDLAIDSDGNIAKAALPYAAAQDAASEIQTNKGEVYFNTLVGIPYYSEILGAGLPLALYRKLAINAAMLVPGVIGSQVFFSFNRSIPSATYVNTSAIADIGIAGLAIADSTTGTTLVSEAPNRTLSGQVQVTLASGNVIASDFFLPVAGSFELDNSQLDGISIL